MTKYLVFREDCYDRFFTKFDFFGDTSCIAFTLGKLVGYVIVAGSTVFKLPQITKIANSKSAKGISAVSFYIETIQFVMNLTFSLHLAVDFSVYGDTIFNIL